MSICAAHCSWVCCSKSTSRMTSYSSSVSRIGSVFSHPLGQNVSTCDTPQIWRHRGGLGMGAFFPLYSVYSDCSTLSRKKQFFSKAATFSVLICVPADIRSRMLHVSLVRNSRLSKFDRTSQGVTNFLGFTMSLVYMQAVHGRLSTYERLVNSQFFSLLDTRRSQSPR